MEIVGLITTASNRDSGFRSASNLLSLMGPTGPTREMKEMVLLKPNELKGLNLFKELLLSSHSGHINPDNVQQVYFTKSLPVGKTVFFKPQNMSSSVSW